MAMVFVRKVVEICEVHNALGQIRTHDTGAR